MAVVHLDDLDVPVGAEPRRRLAHQRASSVTPSEVLPVCSTAMSRGRLVDQRVVVRCFKPGGADDDRRARGARGGKMRVERGGGGEIDEHVGGGASGAGSSPASAPPA